MKKLTPFLFFLTTTFVFAQSPWTQEKGKSYTQISFTTIPNYDTLFGDPERVLFGKTTDNTLQFYGEYGLSKKTTLLVNIPYKLIAIDNYLDTRILSIVNPSQNFSKSALGNVEIGIKHNFYNKEWLLSGQLSVEANTGTFDASSGIRTGYDAWTFTPLLIAGRGFGKSYFQGFIGANIRTNSYSSNFKIGGEIGRKITAKIWLVGFLDIVKSFENGTIILPNSNVLTGLYVNNQEYGGFGFKSIYEITNNFGINAGFGGAFFGNNVAQQGALTVGVYKKF